MPAKKQKSEEYFAKTLHGWQSKTACVKDIFYKLIGDGCHDKSHPCIEWNQGDDERLCMVKTYDMERVIGC